MQLEALSFEKLKGIDGLSDQLLENHFALYQGYVANTNKLTDKLAGLIGDDRSSDPEYAEIKRRLGWEYNGVRLHELYFRNMTATEGSLDEGSVLYKKLESDFGSYDKWKKDFKATGLMRGIGWVVLYYDHVAGRLVNFWINEHDAGHLSGAVPLLVMDVFEHAYMIDYGIKKVDYVEGFFKIIDWKAVSERLKNR